MLASIILAASLVSPVYVNHNAVRGDVQTMTNMTAWATSVTNAIAAASPKTPSSWKTETTIKWMSDGTAISISVPASGTLSANVSGWTDGQVQTARITIASGATISPTVKFVGYGYWPTDEEFLAACIRVGSSVFVNVISATTH